MKKNITSLLFNELFMNKYMIFSLFISLHILGMEQQTTTNPITLDSYYWIPNLNTYQQEATALLHKIRNDSCTGKIKGVRRLSGKQGSVTKISLNKPYFSGVVIRNNNPAPKIILGIQLPTYLQTIEEAEKYMSDMLSQTR